VKLPCSLKGRTQGRIQRLIPTTFCHPPGALSIESCLNVLNAEEHFGPLLLLHHTLDSTRRVLLAFRGLEHPGDALWGKSGVAAMRFRYSLILIRDERPKNSIARETDADGLWHRHWRDSWTADKISIMSASIANQNARRL